VKLCRTIKYASAGCIAYKHQWSYLTYRKPGTVEFLVDDESGQFFFLEMNTRIQVRGVATNVGKHVF
jgi:acetyl/propionyl-CoA carboxylase alpha subunit